MPFNDHSIGISIQARIADVIGAEDLEQKLHQTAQRVSQIGTETSTNITGVLKQPEFSQESSNKEIEKIRKAVEASAQRMNQKAEEMMQDWLNEEEIGLNKNQVGKWQRRFNRIGQEISKQEGQQLLTFIDDVAAASPEGDHEKYQILKAAVKDQMNELSDSYKQAGTAIREYHEQVKKADEATAEFSKSTAGLFEELKRAGYVTLAGMAANKLSQVALTSAEISARDITAFDLTSPLGMYNERRQFELFRETEQTRMTGNLIGSGIGALLGGFAGGGFGAIAGMTVGGTIGDTIAELINKETKAKTQEELKFTNQSFEKAYQYVEKLRGYDIAATQMDARFGENLRGSSGLGYTPEQELSMRGAFGEALGRYNEPLFYQQTMFARAEGINPNDIYQLNRAGRITGYDYSLTGLDSAAKMTKGIFGEDADNKRIVDLLNAIKETNLEMLRLNVNADAREAIRFANIPGNLFGVDNPYGRMGDLGGQTLSILQGLGKPQSDAHEAFLFQAYGTNDLVEFMERIKGGTLYKDNFEKIMSYAQKMGGGSYRDSYFLLNNMMPNAPAEFLPQMARLLADGQIETEQYALDEKGRPIYQDKNKKMYYKEGDKFFNEQGKEENIQGLEQVTKPVTLTIDKLLSDITGKSEEERSKVFESYKLSAEKNKSDFETAQEKISRIHIEIGEAWKEKMLESQTTMTEIEKGWLKSSETVKTIFEMLENAFKALGNKLSDMNIFLSEEDLNKKYHNLKYDAVFDLNGGLKALPGESIDEYVERTMPAGIVGSTTNNMGMVVPQYRPNTERKQLNNKLKEIEEEEKEQRLKNFGTLNKEEKKIVNGYDISSYATDPSHEISVSTLAKGMNFENANEIENYIKRIAPGSPLTGEMILSAAQKYKVSPEMIAAIIQQDSTFGTKGKGARTNNPGNVGNDDEGNTRNFSNWQSGVNAVGEWLSKHKVDWWNEPEPQIKKEEKIPKNYRDSIIKEHEENQKKHEELMKKLYPGTKTGYLDRLPEGTENEFVMQLAAYYDNPRNIRMSNYEFKEESKINNFSSDEKMTELISLMKHLIDIIDFKEDKENNINVIIRSDHPMPVDVQNSVIGGNV